MFNNEPFVTPYDLRFSILGIRVRVQALFWLVALLFGASGKPDAAVVLLMVGLLFISILIHELGHSLMMRRFGIESHIVLYWLGGLAIPGQPLENSWSSPAWRPARRTGQWDQILISIAGPAAGFAFAGLTAVLIFAAGGSVQLVPSFPVFWDFDLPDVLARGNMNLYLLIHNLFWINILWGLVNLVPVYPLDGGQIARELLVMHDPWGGVEKSLILSMATAGVVAFVSMSLKSQFTFFLFLSLAFSSYTAWQQLRR